MKMESWLLLGLVAAVAFAANIALFKYGLRNGTNPYIGQVIFSVGVLLISVVAFFMFKHPGTVTMNSGLIMLASGIVWGIGGISVVAAIALNADISKVALVLTSNAVLSVILGLLLFGEGANGLLRIAIGTVLVVAGVVFINLK